MNKDKLKELYEKEAAHANRMADMDRPYDTQLRDVLEALLDEPEPQKPSEFPLKVGNLYWLITHAGDVISDTWMGDLTDIARLKAGNVFLTVEDALAKRDWDINQHALMVEAEKNPGGVFVYWRGNVGFVCIEHCAIPYAPGFDGEKNAISALATILGSYKAIKAHLTFKSKAVKFTEVV